MTIKKIAFTIILFSSFACDCQSSYIDMNFEDNLLKKQKYQKDIELIYKENNISHDNKNFYVFHNIAITYIRHFNEIEKAIELFKKSAKAGCQRSYSALFFIYRHLTTMDIGPENSHFIYKSANMLYEGKGVKKDIYLAAYGYLHAANLNYPKAQYKMAKLYYKGRGVRQDLKKSFELCQKAANAKIPKAQHMLGYLYFLGEGVVANTQKASDWFNKVSISKQENHTFHEIKNIMDSISF
ncbi:MAG: tetratricopeptide repeat protein [Janthinobacterium lividum]